MKTINKRIILVVSVVLLFFVFTVILMFSMFANAEEYAMKSVNAHLFNSGVLTNAGDIVDLNGEKLAYTENGTRKYNERSDIRRAFLHILGDDKGFIDGGIQNTFKKELSSYNIVYGVSNESKNTLKLTLDADLCSYAFKALDGYKGCIAVCNYKTGEIICLASAPSYDIYDKPTDINDNPAYEGIYINRFFGGLYTPGSIFKLVTAYSAIENIDDIYQRTFYCRGKNGNIICNDEHGEISFKQALNRSCNVAFAQIATELGADKLNEAVKELGLTNSYETPDRIKTSSGIFKITDTDTDTEIGWAGIGQSTTLVNPYSFLTFVCSIANSGEAYEPYLVASAENSFGTAVYQADSEKSPVRISETTASLLKELMRTTVSDYYGDYFFGNVEMCGKTGTAERDNGQPHAWFVGFSYNDSFPYAIVVVMEESGSGLKYAGNAASDVIQELYRKIN